VERGEGNPSLVAIEAIAVALDVEIHELLQIEEPRARASTGRLAGGTQARERIVRYLDGRSPGDLERAMRILAAALEEIPEVS
jgi:transcriptional regulator with XRE-family HTH domain